MADLHSHQIVFNRTVDVASNISSINSQDDAARMINLTKQMQGFKDKLKQVKDQENAENETINDDTPKAPSYLLRDNIDKKNKQKQYNIDEYRGKLIDIRL